MAGRNTANFGQRYGAKPAGSSRVIPQGQGPDVGTGTRGGPPPGQLAKHTQGKSGKVTTNSQPVSGGGKTYG